MCEASHTEVGLPWRQSEKVSKAGNPTPEGRQCGRDDGSSGHRHLLGRCLCRNPATAVQVTDQRRKDIDRSFLLTASFPGDAVVEALSGMLPESSFRTISNTFSGPST